MAQCVKKSNENVLGSWHINTQKPSSAADYQVSTQPVRGGTYDLTGEVFVTEHYVLSAAEKTRAQIALFKTPFYFSIIPGLR